MHLHQNYEILAFNIKVHQPVKTVNHSRQRIELEQMSLCSSRIGSIISSSLEHQLSAISILVLGKIRKLPKDNLKTHEKFIKVSLCR